MHRWKPGKLLTLPHTEAMQTATAGNGITLPDLLRAPHERGRIGLLLLLLTLTAAWIDMLSYLSLGRVFASFMTGNILFIGLGVAQGNSGLLIRALVAVLVALTSAFILTPVVPVIVVTIAIFALLYPARQAV